MWVEQSYKQVKHALGWSEYQERLARAIRRHWQLVCCAFSFCWYHQAHSALLAESDSTPVQKPAPKDATLETGVAKKKEPEKTARPQLSWPQALRAVRAWLEPWVLLHSDFQAW